MVFINSRLKLINLKKTLTNQIIVALGNHYTMVTRLEPYQFVMRRPRRSTFKM